MRAIRNHHMLINSYGKLQNTTYSAASWVRGMNDAFFKVIGPSMRYEGVSVYPATVVEVASSGIYAGGFIPVGIYIPDDPLQAVPVEMSSIPPILLSVLNGRIASRSERLDWESGKTKIARSNFGSGPRAITVYYRAIDHTSKTKTFKTLAGAREFAQKWVGKRPEIGIGYAVSGDGVGTVRVTGASIKDLFPDVHMERDVPNNGPCPDCGAPADRDCLPGCPGGA